MNPSPADHAANLVMRWVLANETTLRTHPQFAEAPLAEIATAAAAHFEAKRIAPERLGRVKAQPYRVPTAGDREALACAAAKRARRGTR